MAIPLARGQCHSRREALIEQPKPGTPFLDVYRPALLEPPLYETDGRYYGEVFEYGALTQTAMARAGVLCLNSDEAHSGRLKAQDNALFAKCPLPPRFDTPDQSHLPVGSLQPACIGRHMPQRIYMGGHLRYDYEFRRPMPPPFTAGMVAAPAGAPADNRVRTVLEADPSIREPAAGIVRGNVIQNGKRTLFRGDRRPKGTPLAGGFTMALVLNVACFRMSRCGFGGHRV